MAGTQSCLLLGGILNVNKGIGFDLFHVPVGVLFCFFFSRDLLDQMRGSLPHKQLTSDEQ